MAGCECPSQRPSTAAFLLLSLVFHLLYTTSIFDIYFTSPVVHPSQRFTRKETYPSTQASEAAGPAPAERLILIVGDGLRADTLFKAHPRSYYPPWAGIGKVEDKEASFNNALTPRKDWGGKGSSIALPNNTFYAAPHLRSIVLERGAWGVSHTRVPTESRPGHVALIAGMYEDVSAVTKGWKLNPVSFDSLFNQSSHTFSFGSPDILPMFAEGATNGKMDMETYSESEENFTADASDLDLWVLEQFEKLLDRASYNTTLEAQLRSSGTVFFLHLLGLDTTGHTYRPHSAEYVGNLMVVDSIVKKVEALLERYFQEQDGEESKTSFIFTSDHGMSNKGNHGDGEPDNTRTPLVAWGAGIRPPLYLEDDQEHGWKQTWRKEEKEKEAYFQGWGEIDNVWRDDVEQADITTLMATLLDIPIPANSEGRLPIPYLNVEPEVGIRAYLANAMEVLEVYRVKDQERRSRMLRYVPFQDMPVEEGVAGKRQVMRIKQLLLLGNYPKAMRQCRELIELSLQGARYLQTYDWLLLVGIVTVGYLGSMAYGIMFLLRRYVLEDHQAPPSKRTFGLGSTVAIPILGLFVAKFVAERSPGSYYAYIAFAAFFWARVVDEYQVFVAAWRAALDSKRGSSPSKLAGSIALRLFLALVALELMAFGYLERLVWSFGFAVLAFLWPAVFIDAAVKSKHEAMLLAWTLCCVVTGHFTIGGLDKQESVPLLVLSGVVFLAAGMSVIAFPATFLSSHAMASKDDHLHRTLAILKCQMVVLIVSTAVTASSSWALQAKRGLALPNQVLAWVVLLVCLTVPFAFGFSSAPTASSPSSNTRQPASQRLAIVIFAFAPVFVLLSIRDETLFFGSYIVTLLVWAKLEGALYEERVQQRRVKEGKEDKSLATKSRGLGLEDVRIATTFLFFLHFGFFGTGNVASISSFYLSPVYRLVPVFNPFLMAALLLLKILVPFVLLGSLFQRLCLTPAHARTLQPIPRNKTGAFLAGPPFFGPDSVGGLSLQDAYAPVLLACIATDVLALHFLFGITTEGSWLEIGRTITHFVMANMLQVFMLAISAGAEQVIGGKDGQEMQRQDEREKGKEKAQ